MAPLGSLAHLLEPEPSFADQLVRLESLYPVHPLFLPIDGGPFDSDEEQELLAKQDAARGLSCARARVAPTKKVHARPPPPPPPKRKARRLPTSPPEPPGPAAQSHRLEQPASSASDEQAMVSSDERTSSSSDEEDAAAAGPTSPPGRPAKRPRDVVELPTDADADEDDEVMVEASSPPIRRQGTAVRAATGAELRRRLRAAARAAAPVEQEGALKGRGRPAKKARLSRTLDQAVDEVNKLNRQKLLAQFSTIASFVDHLAEFERAPTTRPRILDGCRIVFINTDDWTNTAPRKNRFVEALRLNMGIAARNGATLVKPDEFVPPPFDVSDDKVATASDTLATRAETEQWTTHVIPLEPAQGRHKLSYDKVLSCLGTASGGIGPDELGPYVKVVQFKWISACVNARARVDEGEFVLPGDYREGAQRLQKRERALEAELRRKAKARERERRKERQQEDPSRSRRPGARDADGDADEDTQRESDVEDDEPMDGVSPLGPDDWPEGEAPAPGYFDLPRSQSTAASSIPQRSKGKDRQPEVGGGGPEDSSDPIDDPDRTRMHGTGGGDDADPTPTGGSPASPFVYEGLEEENDIIKTLGAEAVDKLNEVSALDLIGEDPNAALSTRDLDDNATDNENSDGELDEESFDPKKKRPAKGWACDNPDANRAHREGPNERSAKTLELLAGLIPKIVDKDEFRIRSHMRAANILRGYETKLERRRDLVKIRGIGDKLANKIIEIIRTGTHRRLSMYETEQDKAQKLFGDLYGIGKTAQDLYAKGARSIDDLRGDPKRYGITRRAVLIGLEYYEDLLDRIPRAEVTEIVEAVKKLAREIDPKLQVDCMGSYRRGADSSGDIDLLVTRDPSDGKTHEGLVKKLWKKMKEAGIAQFELSLPNDANSLDAKINGLCKVPREGAKMRRIDVLGVPWHEMPAALIYFSSGSHFNRSLRLKARRHGYRLNQRGLYKDVARDRQGLKLTEGTLVKGIKTERDIFRVLNVPWRTPEERNV